MNRRQTRENAFGFASDCLRRWREISKPITERSKVKPKQFWTEENHSAEVSFPGFSRRCFSRWRLVHHLGFIRLKDPGTRLASQLSNLVSGVRIWRKCCWFIRAPSVRISRRIKVPSDSISESTGVLNLPNTPNGQASGEITPTSDAVLQKFETSVFPPSPPLEESVSSFEMTDAGSPSTVNHVGHHDVSPPNEVRTIWLLYGCYVACKKSL